MDSSDPKKSGKYREDSLSPCQSKPVVESDYTRIHLTGSRCIFEQEIRGKSIKDGT
jgi:hypothetical protein